MGTDKKVVAAWSRIEAWLSDHARVVRDALAKPATEKKLRGAEKAMGLALPQELRQLYLLHDGTARGTLGLFDGWRWIAIDEVVAEWRDWKALLEEHGDAWAAEPPDADRGVRAENWNAKWIPITSSGSGDHHCVDLAPARGGVPGQVIRMWHDEPLRQLKARSVSEWLEHLADGLESGRLTWSAEDERIDEGGSAPVTPTPPRRFTMTGGGSNKFWEIRVEGASTTVRHGRVGQAGREQTKSHASAAAASRAAGELIAQKTRKGYVEARAPERASRTPGRESSSEHGVPTWAMPGHDAQRTGFSGYRGPQSATCRVLFTASEDAELTAPAVATDGTIHFACDNKVYAVTPQGKKKWVFSTRSPNVVCGPVVGGDGTIYVGHDDYLVAVSPDGKKKWAFRSEYFVNDVAIDRDGTVYLVTESSMVYAVTAGGKQWVFRPEGIGSLAPPAIGHDKTVYLGSRRSTLERGKWSHRDALVALGPEGTQKWAFSTGDAIVCSPVVGNDGTIYVGSNDQHLYAITPQGTKKWAFRAPAEPSSPALAKDGTIYLGCAGKLLAIGAEGRKKWALPVAVSSPPIVGNDGLVYLGTREGLCAVTPAGKRMWVSPVEDGVSTPLAMTQRGTLYFSSGVPGKLYAIGP